MHFVVVLFFKLKNLLMLKKLHFFTAQGNILVTLADSLVNYLMDDNIC